MSYVKYFESLIVELCNLNTFACLALGFPESAYNKDYTYRLKNI